MPALRAFGAHLRAHLALMLQYRGEIVLWSIWGIINPAVFYAMWSSAATHSAAGRIAGLDSGGIAAYYFCIMIVSHLGSAWDVHEMGYMVRSGRFSPLLLQPILPIWKSLAQNLSYKIMTLVFVLPMWGLFAWMVTPRFETTAWQFWLGLFSIGLAAGLNFILGYCVGLVAFWAPKLDAMGEIYFGLGMIFGGRFAPLAAMGPFEAIANYLPFRWMFAFPSELLIGRISSVHTALRGIGIQLVWVLAIILGFRLVWNAAVKRYTAVSG